MTARHKLRFSKIQLFPRMLRKSVSVACMLALMLGPFANSSAAEDPFEAIPIDFVDIAHYVPSIELDVRYFGRDNFVGMPIDGYEAGRVFMTRQAAEAISLVQLELGQLGLGLKIFDAYRPQRAVDHFVRWALDLQDTRMKQRYYPEVAKQNLFRDGYIASRSGHSRGSTVDLSIVSLETGLELDMGTHWDLFDKRSWPSSMDVSVKQRANRMLLRLLMTKYGFQPLPEEWWHFTLENEPFPDTYFDFIIK